MTSPAYLEAARARGRRGDGRRSTRRSATSPIARHDFFGNATPSDVNLADSGRRAHPHRHLQRNGNRGRALFVYAAFALSHTPGVPTGPHSRLLARGPADVPTSLYFTQGGGGGGRGVPTRARFCGSAGAAELGPAERFLFFRRLLAALTGRGLRRGGKQKRFVDAMMAILRSLPPGRSCLRQKGSIWAAGRQQATGRARQQGGTEANRRRKAEELRCRPARPGGGRSCRPGRADFAKVTGRFAKISLGGARAGRGSSRRGGMDPNRSTARPRALSGDGPAPPKGDDQIPRRRERPRGRSR